MISKLLSALTRFIFKQALEIAVITINNLFSSVEIEISRS
jgi:hypothetical protein